MQQQRTYILHIGYKVVLPDDAKEVLNIKEEDFKIIQKNKPNFATMYFRDGNGQLKKNDDTQRNMKDWFKRNENKIKKGYISAFFIYDTNKAVSYIAEIKLDGKPNYVILLNNHRIRPMDAKRKANAGKFGDRILLSNKIEAECIPYKVDQKAKW